MIEFIFQATVHGRGETYLAAEAELIKKKKKSLDFLSALPTPERDWDQRLLDVLRRRVEGDAEFSRCLDFLDQTEEETAATVQGGPVPEWLASKLIQDFGPRVAPLLGVYILKLEEIWPYWKTAGTLLYLAKLQQRSALVFLLEFFLEGRSGQFRKMALEGLLARADGQLLAQVEQRLGAAEEAVSPLRQLVEELHTRLAAKT